MFRALATVLGVVMLSISGSAALQHVHEYADHDHADHHHGPASHSHAKAASRHHHESQAGSSMSGLEACDPGEHAVSVVFTYVSPEPCHVPLPIAIERVVVRPPEHVWCGLTPADVRAHSPPRLTDAPLRAPPVARLA